MADNTPFQSFLPFNHLNDSSFNLAIYEFLMVPWVTMPTVLKHYYLILLKSPNHLIRFLVIF